MAVAFASTIRSASLVGWQDAIEHGFERASKTLRNITCFHTTAEKAHVEDGRITKSLVTTQAIFILEEARE